jgi:hypothetical protein
MPARKKTWTEKMQGRAEPEIAPSVRKIGAFPPGSLMLIPTPAQVKDYIDRIPHGETRTIPEMRDQLAKENGAELTCPMVASIFTRIVSEAALEAPSKGTPFWRLVDPASPLAQKLSCGPEYVRAMRQAEASLGTITSPL